MAPSFKISFPLPRRPSASPSTATPGSQYSNQSNYDDSPILHPGTKAERMLGTSEPDRPERQRRPSRKERKQMGKSLTFMSVTLDEIDGEFAHASDGFPFPGMVTPSESQQSPRRYFGRKGSSPLLGEMFTKGSTNGDNISVSTAPQARRTGSWSTLRSHYDPKKVPLPVSQQTSASSARDMALRKGFPPISSPSDFRKTDGIRSTESEILHARNVSGDSKASVASKLSGNSIKRINSTPRRRPSVTDPPTLYPNADRAFHPVSPPPALINSTLPKTLLPSDPPPRLKWWRRKTSSPKLSPPTPGGNHNVDSFEENFSLIKVKVKNPMANVMGNRNWFDGLQDDEQTLEDLQHLENVRQDSYKNPVPPLSVCEVVSQEARSPQVTSRKSSFSNKSQRTVPSDRKLSFRLDSPPRSSDIPVSSPPNTSWNILNNSNAKGLPPTSTRKGSHLGMDLQVDSFLELSSSSEDEGGGGSASVEPSERHGSHSVRTSVKKGRHNNEALDGHGQLARSIESRSPINRTPSRPLSKRSTSSEYVPPVPKIPDRPKPNQRTSSIRWREIMEQKAASTESTIDSGASSFTDNVNTRRAHSARTKKKPSIRGSKLMKVTLEEEKLLEAMRDKRASIRQDDFEKGFKTAIQLQDMIARPKTAGADGRTSRSSTIYGSRSSISPPPQEYGRRKHLAGSHLSASVDDFMLEDAYPFPEVPGREVREDALSRQWAPASLKSPKGFVSAPIASPGLSFGASDILPSTPTSHDSPLTPSPGHSSMGYGPNRTLSPPRGVMVMNKLGHDRKRTGSSSVVMLDGMDQHAQQLNEENWAMDRW